MSAPRKLQVASRKSQGRKRRIYGTCNGIRWDIPHGARGRDCDSVAVTEQRRGVGYIDVNALTCPCGGYILK